MPVVGHHVIEVDYLPSEGPLSRVLPTLKRRLSRLGRGVQTLRVGVTADFVRRAGEHRGYGFDWFEVLWETTSAGRAAEAESELIAHAQLRGFPLAGDRSGCVRGEGPFAVYVAGR